jgi:hypothetical protein
MIATPGKHPPSHVNRSYRFKRPRLHTHPKARDLGGCLQVKKTSSQGCDLWARAVKAPASLAITLATLSVEQVSLRSYTSYILYSKATPCEEW